MHSGKNSWSWSWIWLQLVMVLASAGMMQVRQRWCSTWPSDLSQGLPGLQSPGKNKNYK